MSNLSKDTLYICGVFVNLKFKRQATIGFFVLGHVFINEFLTQLLITIYVKNYIYYIPSKGIYNIVSDTPT